MGSILWGQQMINTFIKLPVDLDKFPEVDTENKAEDGAEISIGDLHGNAVKLLYFLLRQGVVEGITAEDYHAFVEIYKTKPQDLTATKLATFYNIINKITLTPGAHNAKVWLIGDELADRGMNDHYMLRLFQQLNAIQAPVKVLISNHAAVFIDAYENQTSFIRKNPILGEGQDASAQNLQKLINKGLVSTEEINNIVEKAYKPMLTAVGYSIDADTGKLSIYSHGGVGLDNIKVIALKVGVEYQYGGDTQKLVNTINAINEKFAQDYVQKNQVSNLIHYDANTDDIYQMLDEEIGYFTEEEALRLTQASESEGYKDAPWDRPFYHLVWTRDVDGYRPLEINFIHGHDSTWVDQKNVYNLDSTLGKRAYNATLDHSRHNHASDETDLDTYYKVVVANKKVLNYKLQMEAALNQKYHPLQALSKAEKIEVISEFKKLVEANDHSKVEIMGKLIQQWVERFNLHDLTEKEGVLGIIDLVEGMTDPDPTQRPKMKIIIAHLDMLIENLEIPQKITPPEVPIIKTGAQRFKEQQLARLAREEQEKNKKAVEQNERAKAIAIKQKEISAKLKGKGDSDTLEKEKGLNQKENNIKPNL